MQNLNWNNRCSYSKPSNYWGDGGSYVLNRMQNFARLHSKLILEPYICHIFCRHLNYTNGPYKKRRLGNIQDLKKVYRWKSQPCCKIIITLLLLDERKHYSKDITHKNNKVRALELTIPSAALTDITANARDHEGWLY